MKVSELIELLEQEMKTHGDISVKYFDNEWDECSDVDGVAFDRYEECLVLGENSFTDVEHGVYPQTITINGVEIPKPLSELDIENSSTDDVFYVPSYNSSFFIGFSRMYILRGGDILVYATKEEAIEASKALFGIEG